ncbi:hypothetical protein LCGC14_1081650 [marine sediment metagenome]|uniref:NTP pyrophosphohydrolase MazG putative catalytic core domain-containing protein n=1 Tax=marine sediment metagenome TaxID=412755 RepID=A0A0F9MJW2_9ZZZZ
MLEYDEFIGTTDLSNHDIQYYLDGMNEENGEISGIFKRVRRGDYGEEAKRDIEFENIKYVIDNYPKISNDLVKEIGDRHWYTLRLLQKIGVTWEEVMAINQDKLTKRKEQSKIMGHGDRREE